MRAWPLARAKENSRGVADDFRDGRIRMCRRRGGRAIDAALRKSGARFRTILYTAEHAFTRDEGARFDPEATDQAFAEMVGVVSEGFPGIKT